MSQEQASNERKILNKTRVNEKGKKERSKANQICIRNNSSYKKDKKKTRTMERCLRKEKN